MDKFKFVKNLTLFSGKLKVESGKIIRAAGQLGSQAAKYSGKYNEENKKLIKITKPQNSRITKKSIASSLFSCSAAFTLAEVLITLGIIGVVAAMTLPTVIQKQYENAKVAKLKKNFNIFSQAYQRIRMETGYDFINSEYAKLSSIERAEFIADKFKPYLKISKDCGMNNDGKCMDNRSTFSLSGVGYNNYSVIPFLYKLILTDGTLVAFQGGAEDSFQIFLYVDGRNGKYIMGKDFFYLYGNSKLIYPDGDIMYGSNKNRFKEKCRYIGGDRQSGLGCTAWVIYNGNMDYLRCPDELDWNLKTKCK